MDLGLIHYLLYMMLLLGMPEEKNTTNFIVDDIVLE